MTNDTPYNIKKQIVNANNTRLNAAIKSTKKGEAENKRNHFPYRSTVCYEEKIDENNPNDRLLRQVIRPHKPNLYSTHYTREPLAESQSIDAPGLIQKYQGRALLTVTQSCAIHCQYCFRQNFPYHHNRLSDTHLKQIVDLLKQDESLHEVILSGGDPLMLKDPHLDKIIKQLSDISHLKILRIHSRMPSVLPDRISKSLIDILASCRLKVVLVNHINCAQELGSDFKHAMKNLRSSGVTLLNQSVLLKGVNDDLPTLIDLSHALFDAGVIPYYLHMLDPVIGTEHFHVNLDRAQQLVWQMTQQLPGYLVPKLVKEMPGAPAKLMIPITPQEWQRRIIQDNLACSEKQISSLKSHHP